MPHGPKCFAHIVRGLVVALMLGLGSHGNALAQATTPSGPPPDVGIPGQGGASPSAASPASPVAKLSGANAGGKQVIQGGPQGFGIPAHFSVNPRTGAATYSVPIDVPRASLVCSPRSP